MEKVFHKLHLYNKDKGYQEILNDVYETFETEVQLGNRKLLLILDNKKIAESFFNCINVYEENSDWKILRNKKPCQEKDEIIYLLPNGISMKVLILDNE